jgi:hypothetical protein
VIRGLLRAINGLSAWRFAWSPIGLITRAVDSIVDRVSPPLDGP